MQLTLIGPPTAPPVPPEWVGTLIAVLAVVAVVAWLVKPLMKAWSRRIETGPADPRTAADIAYLRERVADLEAGQSHLMELEERLDFAERLLAQHNALPRLEPMNTPV